MNKEIYKLYLKSNNDYFVIIQKDLSGIDSFTTFFKNKEVLIKRLLDGRECDLSNLEVCIERCDFTSNKEEFLGSDFRDGFKIFNNLDDKMKFLEKITSLTKQILKNYFSEYLLKNEININDKNFNTDSLSNESCGFAYRIINLIDEVNEKGEFSFYGISNINYYIRSFCEKYENFRDLYSYMKAMSFVEDRKDSFTYEEKQEFVEMFYYIKNRFDSFLEKLEEKKAKKTQIEQKLSVEAKKTGKKLVIKERQLRLSEDAKAVAKKIISEENKESLQKEAQLLGHNLLKTEKKESLQTEAQILGQNLLKSENKENLQAEAQILGRNLLKVENKENLKKEAQLLGNNILKSEKKENLQTEAQILGQTLLKVEKKRKLMEEAQKMGKRLSDEYIADSVILEYAGSPAEEDESFKQYLENYYITSGRGKDDNPESIENNANYIEELSLVDTGNSPMVKR